MPSMFDLAPLREVTVQGKAYLASSSEPWLECLNEQIAKLAGKFVEITYRSSYWDEPVRPVFRFDTASGDIVEYVAPAPVMGSGIWIGRVPYRTKRISISPTDKAGPFSFEVVSVRKRRWLSLIAKGLYHAPRATRSAILTRLIGWREESDSNLAWAIGSTRLSNYAAWRRKRERTIELSGIDAPRSAWENAAPIHVWITGDGDAAALRVTVESLLKQVFSSWVAHVTGDVAADVPDDRRIRRDASVTLPEGPVSLLTRLRAGDTLMPYALAAVYEMASRHPEAAIFYGDEEIEVSPGQLLPRFKPGWSPLLHKQLPFLGNSIFFRAGVEGLTWQRLHDLTSSKGNGAEVVDGRRNAVISVRRVLLRTKRHSSIDHHGGELPFSTQASIAIIIPTKDQHERLRRLLASIRRHSGDLRPHLIVINNDSVEAATKTFLETIGVEPDVTVVDYPGRFNFSAMCNKGAAIARSDVLVFLNDDTEVVSTDWLARLKAWALQDQIGAVGAKLTYPDGRLQHVGVLLGMGGSAGHFGSLMEPDSPGWVGRHQAVHEVSAVTGACLAVETKKFELVSGFDEVNLPVELSDIDLCLRLADKGWTSIVDPHIHLLHEESVSRGSATFRRLNVYKRERDCFIERWRHLLRNDPYFHPGLSLFNRTVALG